jgi:predicted nucleic acid-binding protein
MSGPCFLDTNVALYAGDSVEPRKQAISAYLIMELARRRSLVLSVQVLNEYYNAAIAKRRSDRDRSHYREQVRRLRGLCTAPLDADVVETAWSLQDITNYGWWDVLIIASAIRSGCQYLLTEDMQDGHQLGELTILNPFKEPFGDVAADLGVTLPPTPIPER